jgi:diguanylate cyclase (GGDEF)-like protein
MNFAFVTYFQKFILLQEENHVNTAVNSFSTYIYERFSNGQGSANDWGHWNDTYDFIDNSNLEYIHNNLDESTFENLDLNFMIFMNVKDEIIYQLYYSIEEHKFIQFPESFELTDNLISYFKLEEDVTSITKLGDIFYFVSSTSTTDSIMEEPVNGSIIMGREFDNSIITDIETITGFKFYFLNSFDNPEERIETDNLITILNQTYSSSKDSISLELLVQNEYRLQDSVQLNFEMPRALYLSSMNSAFNFAILNTFLCIIVAAIIIINLTRNLTKPFETLLQEVSSIDTTKKKYAKLAETGTKEFFFLRKSMNTLLAKIEDNQEKITSLAMYDQLTGIPNRILFNELLERDIKLAYQNGQIIGIVFIDLDEFKSVNDILGHEIGDELIQQVSQRVSGTLHKEDTVARFGGDEFLLILNNFTDINDLDKRVAAILDLFSVPFILKGVEFFITCSAGVAVYPTDGEDSEQLLKNADMAMYNVKSKGKNAYSFSSPLMKEDLTERIELTNSLYRAQERNELEIYYQPQISVVNNKIVGFEALLRWNHPTKGLLLPGKFISLAEHTRLINPIGQWVLETVCSQIKLWEDMGFNTIKIGVNVSPIQFLDPDFLFMIKEIIMKARINPKLLEIEITESIATNKSLNIEPILHALKEFGVSIAIDDFGTEYSSLSRLKTLSVDRIKMDMHFVHSISKSDKDDAIAKIIIQLAKNLDLNVIAEGIETENQMRFLTSNACDEVQGFYYFRPMRAIEAEKLLFEQIKNQK